MLTGLQFDFSVLQFFLWAGCTVYLRPLVFLFFEEIIEMFLQVVKYEIIKTFYWFCRYITFLCSLINIQAFISCDILFPVIESKENILFLLIVDTVFLMDPLDLNEAQNDGFFSFLKFGSYVFLEIVQNATLRQRGTCSGGKTH